MQKHTSQITNNIQNNKQTQNIQQKPNYQVIWDFKIRAEAQQDQQQKKLELRSFQQQKKDFCKKLSGIRLDQKYGVQCMNHNHQFSHIKSDVLRFVSQCPKANLHQIKLRNNGLSFEGLQLFTCHSWPVLETIKFDSCGLDSKCAQLLSKAQIANLKNLNLGNNNIDDLGVQSITKAFWPDLQSLYLFHNPITSKGLAYIASAEWSGLKQLLLFNRQRVNKVDFSEPIENLKQMFNFPQMLLLNLGNTKISQKNLNQINFHKMKKIKKFSIVACQFGNELFTGENENILLNVETLIVGEKTLFTQPNSILFQNFCLHSFKNIQQLELYNLNVTKLTLRHFLKGQWPILKSFCVMESLPACLLSYDQEKLKVMSKFNFKNLETLILRLTYIQKCNFNIFSETYCPKLKILKLSCKLISQFEFVYLSKIKNERFKMTINTNASMKDKFNDSLGALKPLASMFYEVV